MFLKMLRNTWEPIGNKVVNNKMWFLMYEVISVMIISCINYCIIVEIIEKKNISIEHLINCSTIIKSLS